MFLCSIAFEFALHNNKKPANPKLASAAVAAASAFAASAGPTERRGRDPGTPLGGERKTRHVKQLVSIEAISKLLDRKLGGLVLELEHNGGCSNKD